MQSIVQPVSGLSGTEVVFVDTRVPGYETLVANVAPGAEVVLIDPARDGVAQMTEALAGRADIQAIHIVGHGDSGVLLLGSGPLHGGNIDAYAGDLAAIGQALTADGDIHLWGCDVGAGEAGQAFVQALAEATGAEVAASDDATGAGGDWELEITTGEVATSTVLDQANLEGFDGSLATFSVDTVAELQTALATAATNGAADTITLTADIAASGSGDFTGGYLAYVNLSDDQALTIVGGGHSLDANYYGRGLYVSAGDEVEIQGLTIREGLLAGAGGDGGQAGADSLGAGLVNHGTLTLRDVTVTANVASGGGGGGGVMGGSAGGGGGGGGGYAGVGGGAGGDSGSGEPGAAGGAGVGGQGGGYATMGGGGGGASGGAGSTGVYGYSNGGAGGTASNGATSIGGGGGGSGWDAIGGAGGASVGGIYNASGATLTIIGTSLISNNLGAGGGGGGGSGYTSGFDGGAGGRGVGAIWNAGTLQMTAGNFAGMTGNAGASGSGGLEDGTGVSGMTPAAQNNIYSTGTLDTNYAPNAAPSITGTASTPTINDTATTTPFESLSFADAEGDGGTIAISYTAANGTLSGTGLTGSAGGYTLSGASPAELTSRLQALVFTPTGDQAVPGGTTQTTFTLTPSDGTDAGTAHTATKVTATSVNDAPTATNLTQTVSYTEDPGGAVALGDIVVSDVDAAETVTATLTLSNPAAGALSTGTFGSATSTYNAGTGVWTVTGSAADANAALAGAAFTPAANWAQDVTIATRIRDAANTGPADGTITLDVTAVNDAPTATNLTQTVSYTEDPGGSVALGDIVVSDVDAADTVTATLTLSDAAAGALTTGTFGSATSTYNAGTGVWTVTGSAADVNAALAATAFTPAANWDQDVTIATRIRDAANTGPADGTITLDATAANDAPTATNLTQTVSYTEDPGGSVALGDIVVSDVDTGETVTGTLTLSNAAAGALTTGTFGSATSTYNAGTGVWTVTGSAADVNAALAATAFTPAANWDQDVTVATRIRDAADTGPADGTITLDVTAADDAPTVSSNPTLSATEDAALTITAADFNFADMDTGDVLASVTVTGLPDAGSLTLDGAAVVQGDTITKADIDAGKLKFLAAANANGAGYASFTYTVSDGALSSAAATATIDVAAVNDAPTATAPGTIAVTEDVAAALTGISIADADAGGGVTVTLSAPTGALAATSSGGVTVGGTASALTLTGTIGDINTFIAASSVTYTTASNATADVTLTVSVDDGGNSGSGGALTDSETVTLDVAAVNDAPVLSGGGALPAVIEGAANPAGAALSTLGVAANDTADGGSITGYAVVGDAAAEATQGVWQYSTNGGANWHDIGDVGDGAGALALSSSTLVRFLPVEDFSGAPGALMIRALDDTYAGGFSASGEAEARVTVDTTSPGGAASISAATASVSTSITAVNDAPTTDPDHGYVNAGASTETGGLVAITTAMLQDGDPDDGGAGVIYTLGAAPTQGTLFIDSNDNGVVDGGETLSASATFTQDDIDQNRIKYLHGGGAGTADSFGFSLADGGEDGAAALDDLTFSIAIAERPVVAIGAGSPSYAEDGAAAEIAPALTISDGDSPNLAGATVTITDVVAGDVLGFTSQNGVTGSYDAATGVLTLTGSATRAQYEAALRSVTYSTTNENPATGAGGGDRVIRFQANDGGLTSTGQDATVSVANTNDAPSATSLTQTVSYTEDPGGAVALGDIVVTEVDAADTVTATLTLSDAAAGALTTGTFGSATSTYNAGTGVWTVTGSAADVNAALAGAAFTPAANWAQDVTIATRIRDAANTGPADGTITLDVTPVNDAPTGAVAVTGDATQGETLSASNTLADADGLGAVAYQWRADGVDIDGATGATFALTQDQVAKAITVVASYTDQQGTAESSASSATGAVANVNDAPTGAVTVSGTAYVGQTLAAGETLADLDGLGAVAYQWQADGVDIADATGAALALTADHLGKAITVVASYTDGGGQVESLASAATSIVTNPPPPPPPPPTPPAETVDGVPVETQTGTAPDGTPTQTVTIPIVEPTREDEVGENEVADIPLVTDAAGEPLLRAQVPTGFGLQVSGAAAPKSAGTSLADLIREIQARTDEGSEDQVQLTGGGSGFLQDLSADAPLLVQTITPTMAAGAEAPGEPLVITGAPATDGAPKTALVIDLRGLPSGTVIQLQNVEFAALIGAVRVTGGEGAQNVWGDSGGQYMVLGEGDDVLHGGAGADTVGSEAGDDQLFGDDGADVVFGGEGDDFLHGNAGNDSVNGDAGADLVYGGKGQDVVFGGAAGDLMFGDLDDDVLQGNTGQDTLNGGEGADVLYGGQDGDVLFGGVDGDLMLGDKGDDFLQGNAGADTLQGGDGNDLLHGGQGADALTGGEGNDWLSGDYGDDVLSGGAGADVFMTFAQVGVDRVLDFAAAEGDRVHIDPGAAYTLAQEGADTIIDMGGGNRLLLVDVQLSSLADGWIIGA